MNAKEIVYWKMRNGELISVDDMDINHLRNTLKMIIKNINHKNQYHKKLMEISPEKSFEEIQLNGDMAQFFIEEQNNSFQNDYYELYDYYEPSL